MAQTFNSKIKEVTLAYKRLLKINITDSSLSKAIEENPFYPSLLAISDTFDRYNVSNAAYNISPEQFNELEAPFIAVMDIPDVGSDFVLVTEMTDNTVSYIYHKSKAEKIERTKFYERFKKTAFLAEPNKNSGENNFQGLLKKEGVLKSKRKLMATVAVFIILCILAINIATVGTIAFGIISLLKCSGLGCALLLLAYEIDKSNVYVKSLCGVGGKTNCDAVLDSKAAKIGGISWSEIGFFYFSFTTLTLLAPGLSFAYKTAWLSLFNAVAAPYILFSIYYQWRIVKQWCTLCLTIQSVLAGELVWSFAYFWSQSHSFSILTSTGAIPLIITLVLALLPVVTWYSLKPYLLKAKDYDSYKNAFRRLQNNPDIFHSLLVTQAKAADNWENLGINLGNPDAHNTIISVCSTSCGPCAEAHPKLDKILKNNRNANLKIIFTSVDEHDHRLPAIRHLMAIAGQNDISKTQQALDDWFLNTAQDYTALADRYPMNGELKLQDEKIDAMRIWCGKSEITHTPTIFVNGYRLPENYEVEELMYIL